MSEQESLLISVHMPKTGGLSFRAMLEQHYGEAFKHDYQDYPLAHAPKARHRHVYSEALAQSVAASRGVNCIHGHFLPAKYLLLADERPCTFVTWLRHPVERLLSHYDYWQRVYEQGSPLVSPLHERVISEKWSLEAFCLAPELANVYSAFLWGFPVSRLNFVGITEFFAEDFRYFCQRFLGNSAAVPTVNQRPGGKSSTALSLSISDITAVETCHAQDMALYRRALERRQWRLGGV
ncbi:MAG: hypothetical protein CSA51_00120 [Gammaproteobacteria bacterium]|nr:MAG: hypothetical protein CSA51_00120 [Gammaproteobacteria bacterium]